MNKILIVGDLHCKWPQLNALIQHERPSLILQCGDFSYFPDDPLRSPFGRIENQCDWLPGGRVPIHFCDGNNEHHPGLKRLENNEIMPGVFYQPRGSTLTLPDGRVALFMGGAASADFDTRMRHYDWFPAEKIRPEDMRRLENVEHVDLVISHTSPPEFELYLNPEYFGHEKINDPSRKALSVIFQRYRPKHWFFGHWHMSEHGEYQGCSWRLLHVAPCETWWTTLDAG